MKKNCNICTDGLCSECIGGFGELPYQAELEALEFLIYIRKSNFPVLFDDEVDEKYNSFLQRIPHLNKIINIYYNRLREFYDIRTP